MENHPFVKVIGVYRGILSPQELHTLKGLALVGRVAEARRGLIASLKRRGLRYLTEYERQYGCFSEK